MLESALTRRTRIRIKAQARIPRISPIGGKIGVTMAMPRPRGVRMPARGTIIMFEIGEIRDKVLK